MSTRQEHFTVDGTPHIGIRLAVGDARIVPGGSPEVEVRVTGREAAIDRYTIEQRGDEIVVEPTGGSRLGRWSGIDVEIRVPRPPAVRVRLTSGDVAIDTDVVSLTVESGAGEVAAGTVEGDVRVKVGSGDVRIGTIGGRLEVSTASGDVRVGSVAGDVRTKTAAGDVDLEAASGPVSVHAASGDIQIRRFSGEELDAKTLSGDVTVGVVGGLRFAVSLQTLSGDVRTDFPVSADGDTSRTARLSVKSMSGNIVVKPAP